MGKFSLQFDLVSVLLLFFYIIIICCCFFPSFRALALGMCAAVWSSVSLANGKWVHRSRPSHVFLNGRREIVDIIRVQCIILIICIFNCDTKVYYKHVFWFGSKKTPRHWCRVYIVLYGAPLCFCVFCHYLYVWMCNQFLLHSYRYLMIMWKLLLLLENH